MLCYSVFPLGYRKRQTLLFSATMSKEIQGVINLALNKSVPDFQGPLSRVCILLTAKSQSRPSMIFCAGTTSS